MLLQLRKVVQALEDLQLREVVVALEDLQLREVVVAVEETYGHPLSETYMGTKIIQESHE